MDFLNNSFAEGSRIDMLNFDNVAAILPHASELMNGKYEPHITAGLKTIRKILNHFGPQIVQMKTVPLMGGVDIAREERLKKSDVCVDAFFNIFKSNGMQKALKRKGEVGELALQLHTEL
jgi:hypothetical protein